MATKKPSQSFKVGDRVGILYWPKLRARIVEERGALGPGGTIIYSIRIADKPKPRYSEVREDQLILLPPTPPKVKPRRTKRRRAGDEPKAD